MGKQLDPCCTFSCCHVGGSPACLPAASRWLLCMPLDSDVPSVCCFWIELWFFLPVSVCEILCFWRLPSTVNLMRMFPSEVSYKQVKGFLALVSLREGLWSLVGFISLVHDLAFFSHSQHFTNGVSDFVVKPRLVHKYPAFSKPAFLRSGPFISLSCHCCQCVSYASDSAFT